MALLPLLSVVCDMPSFFFVFADASPYNASLL